MGIRRGNKLIDTNLVIDVDTYDISNFKYNTVVNKAELSNPAITYKENVFTIENSQGDIFYDTNSKSLRYTESANMYIKDIDYNRDTFTVEYLIKYNEPHSSYGPSFSKWQTGAFDNNEWYIGPTLGSGPSPISYITEDEQNIGFQANTPYNYSIGQWYHAIGVYDTTSNIRAAFYVNNELIRETADSRLTTIRNIPFQFFVIGGFGDRFTDTNIGDGSGTNYGRCDKNIGLARLYSGKAFTAEEVTHNFNILNNRYGIL